MSIRNADRAGRVPDEGSVPRERPDERRSGVSGDDAPARDSVIQSSRRMRIVAENGVVRLVFETEE